MKNKLDPETLDAPPALPPMRSASSNPRRITKESLLELVKTMPGGVLMLATVEVEDVYETRHGVGYYPYAECAFFSMKAARACANWINRGSKKLHGEAGFKAQAKPMVVTSKHCDQEWLLNFLNGNDSSWIQTVDCCIGKGAMEPDFGDEISAENNEALRIAYAPMPAVTFALKHPLSGEERLVTNNRDDHSSNLDTLVEEGFAEPLAAALKIESEKPGSPGIISTVLVALEVHLRRYDDAAARGRAIIQRKGCPERLRMTIALALHYAGLSEEAYRLLEEGGQPDHVYQMACCAARMGKHTVALGHLIEATATSETNRVRSLLDEDFDPLWEHFDTGAANFQECALLASPAMARCFGPVPPYDGSLDYLDHFDFARLPERLRPAVKARFVLSTYVPRQPGDLGYDDGLSTELFHFRVTEGLNRRMRASAAWDMAKRAMLVLAEAETCAAAGNMMHSRWHVSEIVRNLPNAASDIRSYCVNEKLHRLADEFSAVEAFRPRFTCDAAASYETKDLNRLAEILKSCPPRLLSLGMIQIYHGHLALAAGDTVSAIQAYLAAADCWPDDAAPFHNAAMELAELGRWDEAESVVARAPASFHDLEVCRITARIVAARSLTPSPVEQGGV